MKADDFHQGNPREEVWRGAGFFFFFDYVLLMQKTPSQRESPCE